MNIEFIVTPNAEKTIENPRTKNIVLRTTLVLFIEIVCDSVDFAKSEMFFFQNVLLVFFSFIFVYIASRLGYFASGILYSIIKKKNEQGVLANLGVKNQYDESLQIIEQ